MADEMQLVVNHKFTPELRERFDAYVAAENERIAPAKLSMRSVLNAALDEYLTERGYRVSQGNRDTEEAA